MQQNSEDQIIEEIINRIDALRYECGYTINKLAEAADIPESTLKSILSRKQCPKIITIYNDFTLPPKIPHDSRGKEDYNRGGTARGLFLADGPIKEVR